jgi:hypothetical protein
MRSINENKTNANANANANLLLTIEDELFNINNEEPGFIESKVKNLWNYLLVRKNKSKNKNSDLNEASKKNNEYKCLIKL